MRPRPSFLAYRRLIVRLVLSSIILVVVLNGFHRVSLDELAEVNQGNLGYIDQPEAKKVDLLAIYRHCLLFDITSPQAQFRIKDLIL